MAGNDIPKARKLLLDFGARKSPGRAAKKQLCPKNVSALQALICL